MTSRLMLIASLPLTSTWCASAPDSRISGRLTDTQGKAVAAAKLHLTATSGVETIEATSDSDGRFVLPSMAQGEYQINADAPGFTAALKSMHLADRAALTVDPQFSRLVARAGAITVITNVKDMDVLDPDSAEKIFARGLPDANPGRPRAPMHRLEHCKQVKVDGGHVFRVGQHPDTVDPPQKDQSHTATLAFNDIWKLSDQRELQLSGLFRSYNLSLDSGFGLDRADGVEPGDAGASRTSGWFRTSVYEPLT